uniref:RNA helicase n=1 Tax=Panagrellus redivivus TaxID=6233 RepID=A0A7E4VKL8_PANRE
MSESVIGLLAAYLEAVLGSCGIVANWFTQPMKSTSTTTPFSFQPSDGSCLRKSFVASEKKFSHIVRDEAEQAAEMEIWQPLAFFASSHTRLIVPGDPLQIGPVTSVHLLVDIAYGYKTLIPSRLYQKNQPSEVTAATWSSKHRTIVLVKPSHANAVVFYIESLLRTCRVKAHEISVVSPYTAQTQLIRRLLGPSFEVTADTVDKFHISERRAIIITAVCNETVLGGPAAETGLISSSI